MKVFGHEHHNCETPYAEAPVWVLELGFVLGLIHTSLKTLEAKMSLLDDKLAQNLTQVTAIKTRLDSLVAYQAGLKQQLTDALAAASAQLTPAQTAVFDQVFAVHKATTDEIDEALNTNVPPPPPPTP